MSLVANSSAAANPAVTVPQGQAPVAGEGAGSPQGTQQFGEVLNNIQAKYGAKPEKGREIKKTLGKDDFLRIMITQMRNQDPTSPFKAEQMAAEMAQFTSVEQMQNMNQTLTKMTTANQPLERMAMTGMIGKTVTVDKSRFPHTEGVNDTLTFGLPRDADQVTVQVVSDQGETVFQKELGKMKAGEGSFVWDGLKANMLPSKSGNYMLRVEAVDQQGHKVEINPTSQARVVGVSFEGSEPVFLVGDARSQQKVTMKNIVRIDGQGDAGPAMAAGAQAGAGGEAAALASPKGQHFFRFQKGVGSSTLDAGQSPPEVQQAIARYQAAKAEPPVPKAPEGAPAEKGFPNGLQDDPSPSETGQKGGNP